MSDFLTARPQPVALTIAGSDSGGNAGIQADLRAFHAFGVHGCTAITALTAQNPEGVRAVQAATPAFLSQQLDAIFDAYSVGAIKTGMLLNAELIEATAASLAKHRTIPKVVDPVMIATSGARLLEESAVKAMQSRLLPQATLITPNLPEAAALLGHDVTDLASAGVAARELSARFGCSVLVKGGHAEKNASSDVLCSGGTLWLLSTPVVRQPLSLHGTGCTLSAAIAAALAGGLPLLEAVCAAKGYVYDVIRAGRAVGPRAGVLGMTRHRPSAKVVVKPFNEKA